MSNAQRLRGVITTLASGAEPRDGLDRVIKTSAGALVVLGYEDHIRRMYSNGLEIDVEFSATRSHELCKMDGVVIIGLERRQIRRANVQLLLDPSILTTESGMRHRTAYRVVVQAGNPVVAVPRSPRAISLYLDSRHYVLDNPETLLSRVSLVIATLGKYRSRFDEVSEPSTALEIDDMVTARDVSLVVQRQGMVHRVGHKVSDQLTQLGKYDRLLKMQRSELMRGLAVSRSLLIRDHTPQSSSEGKVVDRLRELDDVELFDLGSVAHIIGVFGAGSEILETPLLPRGLRVLAYIPRLPTHTAEVIPRRWGILSELPEASVGELQEIDGVGPQRAQIIHDGLEQLAENSVFNRMH